MWEWLTVPINKVSQRINEPKIDMERVLLVAILLIAGYMYIAANEFPEAPRAFPKLTAGITLLSGLLLLVRNYLPALLKRLVTDSEGGVVSGQMAEVEQSEGESDRTTVDIDEMSTDRLITNDAFVTTLLIIGYVVAGYLFSILLATPVFIVLYLLWFRQSWWVIALTTSFGVGLVYLFMKVIYSPLDEGIFFGGI